jgi:hypothetical protein
VDLFLTTSVVISDTTAGHIFTEDHPQLQWCLWTFSVFIYPCTHGKGTFYTFLYSGCILLPSYWWHTFITWYWISFMCSCGGCAQQLLYIQNFKIFHMYHFNFLILDWASHFIIIFNSILVFIMVSFLSLFRVLMYLCIWVVVNLLLSAPDDDPLGVKTCSAFFYIYIYIWQSYCVLPPDIKCQQTSNILLHKASKRMLLISG